MRIEVVRVYISVDIQSIAKSPTLYAFFLIDKVSYTYIKSVRGFFFESVIFYNSGKCDAP